MKKLVSICLLGLYIFALLRPLVPLVDYVSNYTYYSEVLCINKDLPELACKGQCILMQKIKAKAEKENPFNRIVINANEEIPELLPQHIPFQNYCELEKPNWGHLTTHPLDGYSKLPFQPPQA